MRQKQIDTEEKFLSDIKAIAGEHFSEFLIIVKREKSLDWRSSDRTWALGAASRYLTCSIEEDRVGALQNYLRREEDA